MLQGLISSAEGEADEAVRRIVSALAAYRSAAHVADGDGLVPSGEDARKIGSNGGRPALYRRRDNDVRNDERAMVRSRYSSHRRGDRGGTARARLREDEEAFFDRALASGRAGVASEVLGAARRHKQGAALARSGQARGSPRAPGARLQLVHGGLRHLRSEAGESPARRAPRGLIDPPPRPCR